MHQVTETESVISGNKFLQFASVIVLLQKREAECLFNMKTPFPEKVQNVNFPNTLQISDLNV